MPELLTMAFRGEDRKRISAESPLMSPCRLKSVAGLILPFVTDQDRLRVVKHCQK